ncbi:unnamed protein product [Orchesella dallaii]|uniref:BTB domain-containing protein n=1 Tax=Orchesella dallaii TaxID=48710 RepID=A0ABP1QRD4_9HEXA
MGYLEINGWFQFLISLSFYVLIGPVAILLVTTKELIRLPVLLCLRSKYEGQNENRCLEITKSGEDTTRAHLTITKPYLPITNTTIILKEDSNIFMRFVSCAYEKFHCEQDTKLIQEDNWFRSLITSFIDVHPVMEAFQTILYRKKSRLSERERETRKPNFNIQIYVSPRKADCSGQVGQNLRLVVSGDSLDKLLDMCYDKKLLKLKLRIRSFKDKREDDNTDDLEIHLGEIISKEMVATLNTEEFLGGTKYLFEDPDFGKLAKPYLIVDNSFCSLELRLELIADEKAIYGLKLPEWEPIEKVILEEEMHTDFSLVAANGDKIPCNKVYLASRSPVFRQMLKSGMKESTANECKLENMSKEGVKALLKYIYYFSVEDALQAPKIALELMEAGHMYDILNLANTMKQIFIGKPQEWFTIDTALLLFLWSIKVDDFEDATNKAVVVINRKWNDVSKSSMYKEQFVQIPKNLEELNCWTLRLKDKKYISL